MKDFIGNAVIGQSGGPTAAINASLAGVISALLESDKVKTVYGMKNGIDGFCGQQLIDLTEIFTDNGTVDKEKIELLSSTPASALGSCRKKLKSCKENPEFYKTLFELFEKYDIRYFFYIGGNDSMDTVAKLTEYTEISGRKINIIGVPKTIDNDLDCTDHTPGFGSAAKYIATTLCEIIRDCAVYTVPAVTIVEIMGRDAGWLTASAGLCKIITGEGPDYIYLPEKSFSYEKFLEDVKEALKIHPNVVVAVSEGLRLADGHYVGEGTQSGVSDAFGHKYLSGTGKALEIFVKEQIGCKVRSVELNISQRCAAHIASKTDIDESFSVGKAAAEAALSGETGSMMSIVRVCDNPYTVKYEPRKIAKIANAVRCVPDTFINEKGNNVVEECVEYILPLIKGENPVKYKDGLPVFFKFDEDKFINNN